MEIFQVLAASVSVQGFSAFLVAYEVDPVELSS